MSTANALTPERELWAVALWVEKHHGDGGEMFIAQKMDRLLAEGDMDGVAMWREDRGRLEALADTGAIRV